MQFDFPMFLEACAALVTAVGGVYSLVNHLNSKAKRKDELYRQSILNQAKQEMSKIERSLETKIKDLEIELESQKNSVIKDFTYFRQSHDAEVKSLGEKIESLREDLAAQHSALVGLLTKLVNTK